MEINARINTYTRSRSLMTFDSPDDGADNEVELMFTPLDYLDMHSELKGDKLVVAYLVHDDCPSNPMKDWDGEGELITDSCGVITDGNPASHLGLESMPYRRDMFKDYDCDGVYERAVELITPGLLEDEDFLEWCIENYENNNGHEDKRSYLLDCISSVDWGRYGTRIPEWLESMWLTAQEEAWDDLYDEGKIGTYLAVPVNYCDSNHGPCTASAGTTDLENANAVWVPDQCCIDNMSLTPEMTYAEKLAVAAKYADSCLDTYIMWCNGEVFGCVVETFQRNEDGTWDQIAEESCWGFIGTEHAEEALKSEFFEPAVKSLEK